jgi:hypothetical protein
MLFAVRPLPEACAVATPRYKESTERGASTAPRSHSCGRATRTPVGARAPCKSRSTGRPRSEAGSRGPRLKDAVAFALEHRVLPIDVPGASAADLSMALPGFEEAAQGDSLDVAHIRRWVEEFARPREIENVPAGTF